MKHTVLPARLGLYNPSFEIWRDCLCSGSRVYFVNRSSLKMVLLERVEDEEEQMQLHDMINKHVKYMDSVAGRHVLERWNESLSQFVRVIPKDYKRMMEQIRKVHNEGLTGESALLAAFEANMHQLTHTGN